MPHYRVIADPDLPKEQRRKAGEANEIVGKIFHSMGAALIAKGSLKNPDQYVAVECWPSGAIYL